MVRNVFQLSVKEDPAGALAAIACLQKALQVVLLRFAETDRAEGDERLEHLEADVMREVKNLAPIGVDEAEETRAMSIGHNAVRFSFTQLRDSISKKP